MRGTKHGPVPRPHTFKNGVEGQRQAVEGEYMVDSVHFASERRRRSTQEDKDQSTELFLDVLKQYTSG